MNFIFNYIYKDYNFSRNDHRNNAGKLASIIAITLNIILFVLKVLIGTLTNSVAIFSDAFNNLGDFTNSLLSLLGFGISDRAADSEHPFGHGRAEFIASLAIGIVITFIGLLLLQESIISFISPRIIINNIYGVIILIVSIIIKVFLYKFNYKLGKTINSPILIATAKDSLNDIFATSVALISIILYSYIRIPIDSIGGIVVSLFIIFSGYSTVKDTMSELLGRDNNVELKIELINLINSNSRVLGVHDLLIHNYGVNCLYASAHVEVNAEENLLVIHSIIDAIERDIKDKYNINITLHIDPIDFNNIEYSNTMNLIDNILKTNNLDLKYHDFRLIKTQSHTNIIFDLEIPYNYTYNEQEIIDIINKGLYCQSCKYYLSITFDYY